MKHFLFLIFFYSTFVSAQFTFEFDQSIPVKVGDDNLSMPWAGGINAAQYNTVDLNNDGNSDLVIFDRAFNKLSTFLAVDNEYIYSPEYESVFPKDIVNWLIIKDYNCDGKKDLFTSSPFGITTYLNVGETSPLWQKDMDPVLTEGTNGPINLKINGDDIPAIVDMDGDGDLDILTFGFTGSGILQYHQNMSIENSGTCGASDYKRITSNWGDFEECGCGTYTYGGSPCPEGGKIEHVGGKSLLAFDADGDGDFDLVIGEENCNELSLLTNIGDNATPQMRNAIAFPENDPVTLYHYPSAYLEDVTFDGIPDLLVSTNFPFNTGNFINYAQSSWLYKNIGTSNLPSFQFVQKDFIQNQMIELGENTVPAFIDYDGDSDLDMLVVNRGKAIQLSGYNSSVYLYENIGSSANPSFNLKNEDFLGISEIGFSQGNIQFADLNGDGTLDLIFTGVPNDGFLPVTLYIHNNSSSELNFNDQYLNVLELPTGNLEAPYFYDIDKDGRADVLIGKINGNIEYYQNKGLTPDYQFELLDDAFYGISTNFTNRFVKPTVGDLNGDHKPELITTDGTGQLTIYENFLSSLNTPHEGVKNNFYNALLDKTDTAALGSWNWPVLADLYSSGTPEIVLGTAQGGLIILKNTNAAPPGEFNPNDLIKIYPNPGSTLVNNGKVVINSTKSLQVKVISILGSDVIPLTYIDLDHPLTISVNSLLSGLYLALAYSNGKVVEVKRFVVVK